MSASAPLASATLVPSLSAASRLRKNLLLSSCVLLAVGLGVWFWLRQSHVTENDAKIMADMVTISSRVDGWVADRPVTDGDHVAKGAPLAVIDQRETALQLDELRAKDESLRLEGERLATQLAVTQGSTSSAVAAAEARLRGAEANLRSTGAELERDTLDYQRNKQLAEGEIISRQAWDLSRTSTEQTGERLRQAKAQLAEAKAGLADSQAHLGDVGVLRAQLAQVAQERAQVQAQIGQKKVELDDRVVRSPVDGVVDQKFVEPGEYVIPGQRLVLVHDPKSVWVEVHLKETKLDGLKPGQPVSVGVDAYPGREFQGHIERIGTAATSQFALLPSPNPSGNFTKINQRVPVRIRLEQPEGNPLRPGMMVEVDIDRAQQ